MPAAVVKYLERREEDWPSKGRHDGFTALRSETFGMTGHRTMAHKKGSTIMRWIELGTLFVAMGVIHSASLAQTGPADGVKISVTDLVQKKNEVTIKLDATNQSPRNYGTVKAECHVFNKAGMMIGNQRAVLMHDIPASGTAHFDATVKVLSSQVGTKATCAVSEASAN
jgi:hypothetical protein